MSMQIDEFPIVEPGSLQCAVIHPESRDADNVQRRICGGAQAGNISGVRRYFGFDECDVQHYVILALWPPYTKELECILWPRAGIN